MRIARGRGEGGGRRGKRRRRQKEQKALKHGIQQTAKLTLKKGNASE